MRFRNSVRYPTFGRLADTKPCDAARRRLRIGLAALVAALLGLGSGAQLASAATMYLAPTGVSSGDCQTPALPCSSINYVQSLAAGTLEADTVRLAAGDYLPDVNFLSVPNVTWAGPQAGIPADEQTGDTARILVTTGGFGFIIQADNIAFDGLTFQSLDYAASSGSFGLYNLNPSTIRNSVFTHILTGIYAGASIDVSDTKLETANDAMYFTGTQGTVTRTSFNPPAAYAGLVNGANGPLTVTDSNFVSGTYGFLTYAGTSTVHLHRNRFSPSIANGLYNDGSPVNATDNWWGCNAGANQPGCATRTGPGTATTATPWLQFDASVVPNPVGAGATATVTGTLARNSADEPVVVDFPRSSVAFGTTDGSLDHASAPLAEGAATATLTAPIEPGTADVTATLDNETVHSPVEVFVVEPTIEVDDEITTARSGASVAVSGTGHPGFAVQVQVNDVDSGLPVTVQSDGTWTSTVTLGDGDNALKVQQGALTANGPTVVGVYAPDVTSPEPDDEVGATPTVEGTGIPGAVVDVEDEHGTAIGSTTIGGCGCFSVTVDRLTSGPHTLSVTQTTDGVTSIATTVDVTVAFPDPTIEVARDRAMTGETVGVSGTGTPGAALEVRNNGTAVGTTTVRPDGGWSSGVTVVEGTNELDVVEDGTRTSLAADVQGHSAPVVDAPAANALVRSTFSMRGLGYADTELVVTDEEGTEIGRATATDCGCWSLRTTTPLAAGPHTLTITQVVDGTPRSSTLTVVVDPDALELTAPGDMDPILADDLRFTGIGAPGALIRVYLDPDDTAQVATSTAGPDGAFDIPVALPAGLAQVAVTQTPIDGSESDPVVRTLILLLHPPTIAVDGPTAVATGDAIAVSGTAEPDANVALYVNGDPVTDVVADGDGDWTGTVPAVAGDNAIAAMQVDLLPRPAFSGLSDPVHATGVGAPVVTSPAASDHVQVTFDVAGTALPGATVTIADGATELATATADAATGAWSTTTTVPLGYGDHTLAARQSFDGVTGADASIAVVVVPPAPTLTHPDGDEIGDGGIDVEGTADPLSTVDVFLDDATTPDASTTADAEGGFEVAVAVDPGTYAVRVSQRLDATRSGPLSPARNITVLPARPTLQLDSPATVAAGNAIGVSGQAAPGATVLVDREAPTGTVTTFSTTADGFGAWSATLPAASRTNTITARQQLGGAGAISLPSRPPVVVTATPLLAPPAFTLPSHARTGTLTITGTARPGATVSGTFDGSPVGATADGAGAWTVDVTVGVDEHSAQFRQAATVEGTDETSDDSAEQTVIGVPAPTVLTPDDDAVVGASFDVTGTALPNATVTVKVGDTQLASVTANGDGEFTAPVTLTAIGTYALSVAQTRGGVTSVAAVVDVRFPPPAPTFDAPIGFVTGSVRLTGTALAGAAIKVYDQSGSTPVATGTADGAGSYDIAVTRPAGTYHYAVTQSVDGNESARSVTRDVTVWPTALTVQADTPVVGVGTAASVSGQAMPGATVTVSTAGSPSATATANGAGRWSTTVPLAGGRHALEAVQRVGTDQGEPVAGPTVTVLPAPTISAVSGPIDPIVELTGTALPLVTVVVTDETGQTLGTTESSADGGWSLITTAPLAPGDHSLSAHARLAGVDGPRSAGLAVTVRSPAVDPKPEPGPTPTTPTTPATPTPTPTTPTAPKPAVFSLAKPTVRKKTTISFASTLPGAGRVTVTATTKLRVKGKLKRVAYSNAKASVSTAGTTRFVLKPGRKARTALKGVRSAKVTITVTFTPTGGKAISKTTTVTVKGGRR